ncbi:MAG: energy transducer TonB [Bacteroidales bacterium]|nr:energy transducer TonB [Bacteroidales bacterium]MBR5781483.1 energy transducer TonB [Bacteroidales bacterium]
MKVNILKSRNIILSMMFLFLSNILFSQTIVRPEPISGKAMTKNTIQQHLVYPQSALDNKLSGKITVLFTVDKNGNAYNHRVENAFDQECAEMAIHLVKQIQWKPATNNSLPIDFEHEYTVEFSAKTYIKNLEKNKIKFIPEQTLKADDSYVIYEYKELDKTPSPYFNNQNITIGSYLRSELKYPDQAKEFEISGTVKVSFIIETDGKASNIVIVNSVGGGCDNEAIRLIQNLLWIPGVKGDNIVRAKTTQDITFQFGERNYHDGNQY